MNDEYDHFVVARLLDDDAKWFWWTTIWIGLAIFGLGLIGIFLPSVSTWVAYCQAVLTAVAFYTNQRFESGRGKAQELRRKLDLQDSFGFNIGKDEFNDLLLRCSASLRKRAAGKKPVEAYFESKEDKGPRRALHNVRESAWWTEHLAEKMYTITLVITCLVSFSALAALIFTLATVESTAVADLSIYTKISRSITSVFMLILSLGLLKLTISYYKFSKGAAKCKAAADSQLSKGKHAAQNIDAAIMRMYDYFIIRSSSPIIPSTLWVWHRAELNRLYPYKSSDMVQQAGEQGLKKES